LAETGSGLSTLSSYYRDPWPSKSFEFPESDDSGGNHDKEVVFSEKVSYLTFGDYPALGSGPVEDLAFAPDQEGILLTVHGSGRKQ